jgi:hypothetical protein
MAEFAAFSVDDLDRRERGEVVNESVDCGAKFLPLAVLLGALAFLARRSEACEALLPFTVRLGAGLQAANDVLNCLEDHRSGQITPLLARLYAAGALEREAPAELVRWRLLESLVLAETLQAAREQIVAAEQAAGGLSAHHLAAAVRERLDFLQSVPHRLLSLSLGRRPEWD